MGTHTCRSITKSILVIYLLLNTCLFYATIVNGDNYRRYLEDIVEGRERELTNARNKLAELKTIWSSLQSNMQGAAAGGTACGIGGFCMGFFTGPGCIITGALGYCSGYVGGWVGGGIAHYQKIEQAQTVVDTARQALRQAHQNLERYDEEQRKENENGGPNDDEGGPNDDEGGPNDDEGGPNDDEGGPNDDEDEASF